MNCVILQPSYIPWRGYFHQILLADTFVFYDDVQFDKHGWRNRNRIKTSQGPIWLTVPVHAHGQPINEVEIDWHTRWNRKHWASIEQAYKKAPFFGEMAPVFKPFFEREVRLLVDLTIPLTLEICKQLGIRDKTFLKSSALGVGGGQTERLTDIVKKVGATTYLSGPSAKSYLDESKFTAEGLELKYMEYSYREYSQLYPPYESQVSILDLLFTHGPASLGHISSTASSE